MNKNIILHIGLPKTATTFLQESIFTKINNILYLGHPRVEEIQDTPLIYVNDLNHVIQGTFKKYSPDELNNLKTNIINYLDEINETNILFSNETLCGQIVCFQNCLKNAIFLKNVFNSPRIVFTVRKQADWADSIYNQIMTKHNKYIINEEFLAYRHGHSINKFFNFKNGKFNESSGILKFDWLAMTENYIEIFGKENVLVLPYEMLKEDLNEFLHRFYEFTGFEPYFPEKNEIINKRTPDKFIKYSPILSKYSQITHSMPNSWVKGFIMKNDKGLKKFLLKNNLKELDISKEVLSMPQKEIVKNYYSEPNKKLSELIRIDLGQYGYY